LVAPSLSALTATAVLSSGPEWGGLVASYLLGAIPFGLLIVAATKRVDLRTLGSGNIGATNAMRVAGRPLGLVVFLLDVLKGWAPVALLAPALVAPAGSSHGSAGVLQVAYGAAAVLGHCFPVYLRFRGGKGVATACGALIGLDPLVFLIGGAAWLVFMALFRYTSLASMAMAATFAMAAWLRSAAGRREVFLGALLLALLIVVRHRSNIGRMLAGTEPKAGRKGRGP
jgi:glycerol-3-phosphate acyltransferase PlsY